MFSKKKKQKKKKQEKAWQTSEHEDKVVHGKKNKNHKFSLSIACLLIICFYI
jgi:hypothetical protein